MTQTTSFTRTPRALVALLLGAIVLLAGALRYVGQNWDDFAGLHPDERFLTMNLLPLVGGGLEFTPDETNFPRQSLYVRGDSPIVSRFGVLNDPATQVGVLKGSFSARFASWWVGENRTATYDNVPALFNALTAGAVQVVLTGADVNLAAGNVPDSGGALSVRFLETITSEAIQAIRCQYFHPSTAGVGGYFDTLCSPLNPHNSGNGFYAYGTLPLFIAHWAGDFIRQQDAQGSSLFSFEGFAVVWRFFSAFFDVGSVIVVFFIGARLYGWRVGLLAALLYAGAPLAIQKAHYGTVNAITAFFVVLALWAGVGVQQTGKFFYYALFGVAFGASLAGRINLLPLVGVVVLAAGVWALPVLDGRVAWTLRRALLSRAMLGLVIAGVATLVTFRLANPYAFMGAELWGILPNPRWLGDMASAREGVSGRMDSPPNFQWVGRAAYLYPLKDMFLWGMGVASATMAWLGVLWGLQQLIGRKINATQHLLLLAWVVAYFGFMGNQWVMTMRYYLPLYGALAVLGAWATWQAVRYAGMARALLGVFGVVLALVPLYELANGILLTSTATVAGVVAGLLLVGALLPLRPMLRGGVLVAFVGGFSVLWGVMFTNIYQVQTTRIQASRWVWERVAGDFSMTIEGAPATAPLINIALTNIRPESSTNVANLLASPTRHTVGAPQLFEFVAPASGVIRHVDALHLADEFNNPEAESLYISIARKEADGTLTLLGETTFTANFTREKHPLGDPYKIPFPSPVTLEAGVRYTFKVEATAGAFTSAGAVVLTEGDWDDRLTTIMVCQLPHDMWLASRPPSGVRDFDNCNGLNSWRGLVQSYDMAMSYPIDDALKRESIREALHIGEYLTITSNRFYDTEPRHRTRFPLTSAYYDALFAGELGYELVEVFSESYRLGDTLRVDDQHLPIYGSPMWFNEFEADEAFHVYDHPTVFVFKKRADYDPARVDMLLNNVPIKTVFEANISADSELGADMVGVINWTSLQGDAAPNTLMLAPDTKRINQEGGTWSELFDDTSPLFTSQALGVGAFWLVLSVYGLAAFPFLFAFFPQLADRGYAFARLVGLLVVGYIAWLFASVKVPLWSQAGVALVLLALLVAGSALAWRERGALRSFLRERWRLLLTVEGLALGLYVAFVLVRLTNPDLWHDFKGGEKPMDFAYFNAVLRATTFPPPDPWFSGGYINYYYWGYVLVGSPVLLLKLVPSFAYNLIIPALFALTGVGAFGVAFNVVAHLQRPEEADDRPLRRAPNPYWAGVMALLLCVVLGNLDTVRVLGNGLAQLGGYSQPQGMEQWLLAQVPQPATEADVTAVQARAQAAFITDRIAYELTHAASLWAGIVRGIGRALSGDLLPIGSDRWYWGPSRVLAESPGVGGNAITEMPYFTFIYGDLHAHMINLPVLLLVTLFLWHEVAQARDDRRKKWALVGAWALGALAVGMIRAINTWDFPAFLLFAVVGLGYAWWLRYERLNRASLTFMLVGMGGFVVGVFAFALPYTTWYAATYGSVGLWRDGKTPLWAYFIIHGVFLVLLVAWLCIETTGWLKAVKVKALRGRGNALIVGAFAVSFALVLALGAAMASYQVALWVVPLLLWIAFLFFRPRQSLPVQFTLVVAGLALSMTLGVEIVVLGGDIGRQNTVFKFYMQAWVLFAVMGGVAWTVILRASEAWSSRLLMLWYVPFLVLVFIAAMFPVMSTRARAFDRMSPIIPTTLDGLEYMQTSSHALHYSNPLSFASLRKDYGMVRWLQQNVQGTPYILEGRNVASEYTLTARIAINSGLPTVLGWRFHQTQQRTFDPLPRWVDQRELNVKYAYNTADVNGTVRILWHYDVSYVIVGDLERAFGTAEGIAKFARMSDAGLLKVAYEIEDARIYEVDRAALEAYLVALEKDK